MVIKVRKRAYFYANELLTKFQFGRGETKFFFFGEKLNYDVCFDGHPRLVSDFCEKRDKIKDFY